MNLNLEILSFVPPLQVTTFLGKISDMSTWTVRAEGDYCKKNIAVMCLSPLTQDSWVARKFGDLKLYQWRGWRGESSKKK
jgi:hypothetical protein